MTCALLYVLTVGKNQQKGLLLGLTTIRLNNTNHLLKIGVLGVIVLAITTAGVIAQTQHNKPVGTALIEESDAKTVNELALSVDRAVLKSIDLALDFNSQQQKISLNAKLDFVIPAQKKALKVVTLQLPHLFDIDTFELTTEQKYRLIKHQGHYYLDFEQSLAPAATFTIKYAASTLVDGHFGQAKVMAKAAFLSSPDFLLQSRSSQCTANQTADEQQPTAPDCFADENYLLADKVTGSIEFVADDALTVLSIGEHSSYSIGNNRTRHQFTIKRPNYAVFSLSAAEFQTYNLVSNGITINVHGSPELKERKANKLAKAIDNMVAFYAPTFGGFDHKEIHLIEQPSHLGEAVSYDNIILFSEQIISTLAVESKDKGPLLNELISFVLAHEVSHHWFGYKLVPTKQPGQDFLLESFAQFLAYSYLDNQQTMSLQTALENEKARYCKAIIRMKLDDDPLLTIENKKHLAYHKGAYVLLLLDKMLNGKLLLILGDIVRDNNNLGDINAADFSQLLLKHMPEELVLSARNLIEEGQSLLQQNCSAKNLRVE